MLLLKYGGVINSRFSEDDWLEDVLVSAVDRKRFQGMPVWQAHRSVIN